MTHLRVRTQGRAVLVCAAHVAQSPVHGSQVCESAIELDILATIENSVSQSCLMPRFAM